MLDIKAMRLKTVTDENMTIVEDIINDDMSLTRKIEMLNLAQISHGDTTRLLMKVNGTGHVSNPHVRNTVEKMSQREGITYETWGSGSKKDTLVEAGKSIGIDVAALIAARKVI